MAAADKDLGELRKEHNDLSDYIGRISIIFLTILCLLVISFSRAWSRVHGDEVKVDLSQIHQAHEPLKERPHDCEIHVSYIFGALEWQTAAQFRSKEYVMPCSDKPSGPFAQPLTQKQRDDFCACQKRLEAALDGKAISWFVVKAPIPGIETTIDLRYWILSLPVAFCVSALYLYILRKKLTLLEITATDRLREGKPEEVTQLDRLYFEGGSTYLNFPAKLTSSLFVACYFFLPLYLIYIVCSVAWTYRKYGGLLAISTLIAAVLTFAFYAMAVGYSIGRRLEQEMVAITGVVRPNKLNLFWGRCKSLANSLSPRISLAIGCALVLLSLFLSLSKFPFHGYQLAWAGSTVEGTLTVPGYYFFLYAGFGRTVYLLALLLTVLTIFLLIPSFYSLLDQRWIRAIFLGTAVCLFLTNVVAFSVSTINDVVGLSPNWTRGVKLAALLITFATWLGFVYTAWKVKFESERRRKIRAVALVVYAPFFLLPIQYLLPVGNLGLFVFFAGTALLALGFVQAQYRSALIANSPPKS